MGKRKNKQKGTVARVVKAVEHVVQPKKKKNKAKKGPFSTVGNFIGGAAEVVHPGIGRAIKAAGRFMGRVTGLGAYHVNKNTLLSDAGPPMFGSGDEFVTIKKREFVSLVQGSTDFTKTDYVINPGNETTFPFLSRIAANFEQYRLNGMLFSFKTNSATAIGSTNTALGAVIMATQYDVYDQPFSNRREMENYQYATSVVPCDNMLHPIECKRSNSTLTELYVRPQLIQPDNGDLRFYDFGRLTVATEGMQAASTIGELWVTYDVHLIKPKLPGAASLDMISAHWKLVGGAIEGLRPILWNAALMPGSSSLIRKTDGNPSDQTRLIFDVIGRYVITYYTQVAPGTAYAALPDVPAAISGCSLVSFYNSSAPRATYSTGGHPVAMGTCVVDVLEVGATFQVGRRDQGVSPDPNSLIAELVVARIPSQQTIDFSKRLSYEQRLEELEKLWRFPDEPPMLLSAPSTPILSHPPHLYKYRV